MRMTHSNLFFQTRYILIAICWGVLISLASLAKADAPMFHTDDGKAIAGYDVVTFFTEGTPLPGSPEHSVMWKGAIWQFSSNSNREQFEANPRAYAPQYGGYCAFGVSQGMVLGADPMLYKIKNGKLYLIHSEPIWGQWIKDVDGNVAEANSHWPTVLANH